jgi:hypothetical protein
MWGRKPYIVSVFEESPDASRAEKRPGIMPGVQERKRETSL